MGLVEIALMAAQPAPYMTLKIGEPPTPLPVQLEPQPTSVIDGHEHVT